LNLNDAKAVSPMLSEAFERQRRRRDASPERDYRERARALAVLEDLLCDNAAALSTAILTAVPRTRRASSKSFPP
jgi:hypothetical protein